MVIGLGITQWYYLWGTTNTTILTFLGMFSSALSMHIFLKVKVD
jgi:hypothetical protein